MAIVKRLTKGSALTHAELDGNFTDLDTRVLTLESSTDNDSQTLTFVSPNLTISNGNSVNLSSLTTTTLAWSDITATPTTIAGYGITDAFSGDYGDLTNSPTIPSALTDLGIADGTAGQVLTTDGAGTFTFTTVSGSGGGIELADLSVTVAAPGTSDLEYDNTTGVFNYTPPDLSGYLTSYTETSTLDDVVARGSTTASAISTGNVTVATNLVLSNDSIEFTFGSGLPALIRSDTGLNVGTTATTTTFTSGSTVEFTGVTVNGLSVSPTSVDWSIVTNTPTNLAGYGIVDGYDDSDVDLHIRTTSAVAGEHLTWDGADYQWEPFYTNSDVDTHLNTSTATTGQILSWNGSDYAWVADQTGSGGLANIVEDTTPQLGGALDTNGNNITGTGNLTIQNWMAAYDGYVTISNGGSTGPGPIQIVASAYLDLTSGNNNDINMSPHGSGRVKVGSVASGIVEAANFMGHADQTMYLSSKTTSTESTHITLNSTSGVQTTLFGAVDFVSGGSVDFTGSTVTGLPAAYSDSDVATYLNGNLNTNIIPDTNSTYDIGSAEFKIRHFYLSNNSMKFVDDTDPLSPVEYPLGVTTDYRLQYNGVPIKNSSYADAPVGGPIDITLTNHFVVPGQNYTLADGTYVGQELKFWRNPGSGFNDITVANAIWTNGSLVTATATNFTWRLEELSTGMYSCIWNGTGWILANGSIGA